MARRLWRQITWRLFASYLVVGLAAIGVLGLAGTVFASNYFNAHANVAALPDFRLGLFQGLVVATIASIVASVGVSLFVSQRIVGPLRQIMDASRHIASGHYEERVPISDDFEVTQLAISFNQMADAIERTEERRQALIADVAHELRTPLTSIKGYMEALMDGVMPADDATYSLIYKEADRLYRLVQDLQELSRLEAGQAQLDTHPLDVAELVRGVVARVRPQFEVKGVRLTTTVGDDVGQVIGDADRLFQVLLNLVSNALQYTPAGGRVDVRAFRERGLACVAVADTGFGIAPEHLGHVFSRFYRVDKSRSRLGGGTGIGLTIAKHLVEVHGGTIAVASTVGLGSTFTIALPEYLPTDVGRRSAPVLSGHHAHG
jgi:signal transduction histidine kinase